MNEFMLKMKGRKLKDQRIKFKMIKAKDSKKKGNKNPLLTRFFSVPLGLRSVEKAITEFSLTVAGLVT